MKRMTALLIFLFFSIRASSPEICELIILQSEFINFYTPLIKAVVTIESSGNPLAYNVKEQAVGAFQIRQCRIDHYNQLNHTHYKLEDCFSYELSKKVFLFFTKGRAYEQVARSWNGSGPMTITYWNKVKKRI
jgi:hypothetical protein